MKRIALFFLALLPFCTLAAKEKPFIIGELGCELGNNLFQVAAASALAWDNGAEAYFPDLLQSHIPNRNENYEHVLFRCEAETPKLPINFRWNCPREFNFTYTEIPYEPNMLLGVGAFQSEKYFAHHRDKILKLFAPHPEDLNYIRSKYGNVLDHPKTVGIQMRWFGRAMDTPWHDCLVQYGREYFKEAIAHFPPDSLFVVSSNDKTFIKESLPSGLRNVVILENESHYIDFYILSLCKHQIISNSSYGWWAAWLNQNPSKVVVAPCEWINPALHEATPVTDVWPPEWIRIQAKWRKPYNRK